MTYKAQLVMQAQVPNNELLEPHLKYSVEYDILCPKSKCENIKANGFDPVGGEKVQKYYCKKCNRNFYAHTSWLMVMFSVVIIEEIIVQLFAGNVPAKMIADRYHLSVSTISKLTNQCDKYVSQVISRRNDKMSKFSNFKLPAVLDDVVWIDETFFKVKKQSWALIMAVDSAGRVIGWKFSKTRKSDDIREVMDQVSTNRPNWRVVIGDGAKPYASTIRSYQKEAYLIQQFHTHPWEKARITKFTPFPNNYIREDIIEIDYQALLGDSATLGQCLSKIHDNTIKIKKTRGRPPGSKNKPKSAKKKPKKPLRKRGPKTPKNNGTIFQFGHTLNPLQAEYLQPAKTIIPDLDTIGEMLGQVLLIFGNRSILSNRIESVNAEFKNVIPERGMHTEDHIKTRIKRFIELRDMILIKASLQMTIPFSARLGFNNMGQFLVPNVSDVIYLKELSD